MELADSDVLMERALHLPSRVPVPSQIVRNIGIRTWSLYSHVLQASYALAPADLHRTTGTGRGKHDLKEDVRNEAKSKQMPLQTSRQATKAIAQQVPKRSSDILFDSEPVGATRDYCNVQGKGLWQRGPHETQTVSRADGAGTAGV
jgi:hypothetical protein